jgi:hypothetical protein
MTMLRLGVEVLGIELQQPVPAKVLKKAKAKGKAAERPADAATPHPAQRAEAASEPQSPDRAETDESAERDADAAARPTAGPNFRLRRRPRASRPTEPGERAPETVEAEVAAADVDGEPAGDEEAERPLRGRL